MSSTDLLSATGALLLVVGLIVLLRFGARFVRPRMGASASGARLHVAAQLGLDGKRRLQLVECDGARVLVLTGGGGDVMLACPPAIAERA